MTTLPDTDRMVTVSVAVVVNPLMKLEYEDPVCWLALFFFFLPPPPPLGACWAGGRPCWGLVEPLTSHSAAWALKPDAGVHCTLVIRTPSGSSNVTQPIRLPPGCNRIWPLAKLVPSATDASDGVYACSSEPVAVALLFAFSSTLVVAVTRNWAAARWWPGSAASNLFADEACWSTRSSVI